MQNYFELFDLETSFFISDANLKDSYRREIARFHPDKYASKTDSDEKDTSMAHDFLISQIELREELEVIESKTDSDQLEDFILRIESHIQSKVESISNAFQVNSDSLEIKKDVRELKFYEQLAKETGKLLDEWL